MNNSSVLHRSIQSACESCGAFIEYWGFKSIHGKVWAYLAFSSAPVSQSELACALGVSRSHVNMAIADLTEYGLVKPVDKRHHAPYMAIFDVWPIIADVLRKREWMLLEGARVSLEAALEAAEIDARKGIPITFNIERIRQLLQMTEWSQSVLKMLINARLPQAHERWGAWMDRAIKLSHRLRSLLGREG